MARVTVEDCLKQVPNRFVLVLLAAKRARQILKGAKPVIDVDNKPVVIALREIAMGKVVLEEKGELEKNLSEVESSELQLEDLG